MSKQLSVLENYLMSPLEGLDELIQGSEIGKPLKEYDDLVTAVAQILDKYKGDMKVYKPEEIAQVVLGLGGLRKGHEGLKRAAIEGGYKNKLANEIGKRLLKKSYKILKYVDEFLNMAVPERGAEVLKLYKETAENQFATYNALEGAMKPYMKRK